MYMSDVMTSNVITIPSRTSLAEARRIMDTHRLQRLPVVDRGKLTGIVTRDGLNRAGPSQLTSLNIHDIARALGKATVKEVMVKNLVTVSPDATVEEGVALAQDRKVGSLLVVDNGRLIGIATTNDFFYKLLNPILGIGRSGARLIVRNCRGPQDIERIMAAINRLSLDVETVFILPVPKRDARSFVIHLTSDDSTSLIAELSLLGFTIERRAR